MGIGIPRGVRAIIRGVPGYPGTRYPYQGTGVHRNQLGYVEAAAIIWGDACSIVGARPLKFQGTYPGGVYAYGTRVPQRLTHGTPGSRGRVPGTTVPFLRDSVTAHTDRIGGQRRVGFSTKRQRAVTQNRKLEVFPRVFVERHPRDACDLLTGSLFRDGSRSILLFSTTPERPRTPVLVMGSFPRCSARHEPCPHIGSAAARSPRRRDHMMHDFKVGSQDHCPLPLGCRPTQVFEKQLSTHGTACL
eukprot:2992000-Rhodomonas_salina.1